MERYNQIHVLKTMNPFLKQLEVYSDHVMQYEDINLLKHGITEIPLERLKIQAINNIRRFQKQIKGNLKEEPILDDVLIYELADWFKNEYMTWINKPSCKSCGGDAKQVGLSYEGSVRVEEYLCCSTTIKFHRYNDIRKLLQTRKGRCGEYANIFTFFCRCLGYDARYIFCTEDHVWTEVYSHFQNRWIHIDPSENIIDSPLIYEHGWKKQISYVVAFSKDCVQDVTWRYSNQHKVTLARRNVCNENELLHAILKLREKRQQNTSSLRRKFLTKIILNELVEFLIEKKIEEGEKMGRISGDIEWRKLRGESGTNQLYQFTLSMREVQLKQFNLKYSSSKDVYIRYIRTNHEDEVQYKLQKWDTCIYSSQNIFRKYEPDWKMFYLARKEHTDTASILWKFDFSKVNLCIDKVTLLFEATTYENGTINIIISNEKGIRVNSVEDLRGSNKFSIEAILSNGRGDNAWQHTQLFRQTKNSDHYPFHLQVDLRIG